jgi:hypothetical protein
MYVGCSLATCNDAGSLAPLKSPALVNVLVIIDRAATTLLPGALGDDVREFHRHYHVPASNTTVGHIVLEALN